MGDQTVEGTEEDTRQDLKVADQEFRGRCFQEFNHEICWRDVRFIIIAPFSMALTTPTG